MQKETKKKQKQKQKKTTMSSNQQRYFELTCIQVSVHSLRGNLNAKNWEG